MTTNKNLMNVFLSNLAVMHIKLHCLHWNVVGSDFIIIHKMTEKMYKMCMEQFDTVAEVMKMQNEIPLASMEDYLENATIEELDSRDYTTDEVLEEIDADCQTIMDLAKDIRNEADKKDNFLVANLFEDYLAVYAKKSWMIRAMMQEDAIPLEEFGEKDDDSDD